MKSGRCCFFLLDLNLQILFFLHQFSPIFFELHVFCSCLLNSLVPMGNCALQFFDFLFCISGKRVETYENVCLTYLVFILRLYQTSRSVRKSCKFSKSGLSGNPKKFSIFFSRFFLFIYLVLELLKPNLCQGTLSYEN